MSFVARYPGRCADCDEQFTVGELISGDSHKGYKHTICPETEPEKPTKFQGTSLEDMGF